MADYLDELGEKHNEKVYQQYKKLKIKAGDFVQMDSEFGDVWSEIIEISFRKNRKTKKIEGFMTHCHFDSRYVKRTDPVRTIIEKSYDTRLNISLYYVRRFCKKLPKSAYIITTKAIYDKYQGKFRPYRPELLKDFPELFA